MDRGKWVVSDPAFEADGVCPNYRIWPWNGHRRFAYDLVRLVRPKRFVELGAYWGTSFFAFCQAVKDFGIQPECIAVDTWEGDEHTGPYEKDAFETFERVVREVFAGLRVRVLKTTFEKALPLVEEGSVDILHIDGCHEYQAVRSDYLSWLPKLAENGVVLFHDVADGVEYESVRFWKEISAKAPGFSFPHSWGLGVLFPKGDLYFRQMKNCNFEDKLKLYEYRSELDYALVRIDILKKITAGEKMAVAEKENEIDSLKKTVESLQRTNETAAEAIRRYESSPVFCLKKHFNRIFGNR